MHKRRGHARGISQQYLRGMVIRHRIAKHRELNHVGRAIEGRPIEANVCNQIASKTVPSVSLSLEARVSD